MYKNLIYFLFFLLSINSYGNDTLAKNKRKNFFLVTANSGISRNQLLFSSNREYAGGSSKGFAHRGYGSYKGPSVTTGFNVCLEVDFKFSRYFKINMDWNHNEIRFSTPGINYESYDESLNYKFNYKTIYYSDKIHLNYNTYSIGIGNIFNHKRFSFLTAYNIGFYKVKKSFCNEYDSLQNFMLNTKLFSSSYNWTKEPNIFLVRLKGVLMYRLFPLIYLNLAFSYSRLGPNGGHNYNNQISRIYEFTNINIYTFNTGLTLKL